MKINILSMQKVNNYGSVLQAYFLKQLIESLNHEVNFIDIKKGKNDELNNECWKLCTLNNNIEKYSIFQKFVLKIKNLHTKKMYENFRRDYLGIYNDNLIKYSDVCVIGSDEVFNCLQISKWGFDTQLYGDVSNTKKIITYAACCGATTVDKLSDKMTNEIKKYFKNISSFSVRDQNTYDFVYSLANIKPNMNIDPVLTGDIYKIIKSVNISKKIPKKYCVIYAYQNRINDKETIDYILSFCKKNNLVPISVFGKQKWIKKHISLSPFELLKVIQKSNFVITDTFHGTIFSIKTHAKFCTIIRESNKNKLSHLLEMLELENRTVNKLADISKLYNSAIDYAITDKIISDETNKSIEYLKNNL